MFICACYHFHWSDCIFHLCTSDNGAQWRSLFYVFICERVFVSDVLFLISIWYICLLYDIYTGDIIYITYDSSPPSCGLLVKISNTSLRIKDACLIFTTTKICSNVNK